MGRNCCCAEGTPCDPTNCPLCSCVSGIPEKIKFKDFPTAKYKISGFRDIEYDWSFGGQGGSSVFIGNNYDSVDPTNSEQHVPFEGRLSQSYHLKVKGFESLNDEEFEFDLINADAPSYPGRCLYKPKISCLIPYNEVEITEHFSYDANGDVYAEITPIIMECTLGCDVLYNLIRRDRCWYTDRKNWKGKIGYTAKYDLYVKLQTHSAINDEWIANKKPKCDDGLPQNHGLPPCEDFEDCEKCDGSGSNDWYSSPIKIILILRSVSPILEGDEEKTGTYIAGCAQVADDDLFFNHEYFDVFKSCGSVPYCQYTTAGPNRCRMQEPCDIEYKYRYDFCNNPFVSNFNILQPVSQRCPFYGSYLSTKDYSCLIGEQPVFVNYGRVGLSDEKVKYFTLDMQLTNGVVEKGLVGYEFSNHKNFSFLKVLPFGPLSAGPVCDILNSVNSCIEDNNPCILGTPEYQLPSVLSFCLGWCPKDHICRTYDDSTEELEDEYFAFGNYSSENCEFADSRLNDEICVCTIETEEDKNDCEDKKLSTDKYDVYGCASFNKGGSYCYSNGISSNLTNDILKYLFRKDRYEGVCKEDGNESDFLDPEENYDERTYTFTAKDGINFPNTNLFRHAVFGIETQVRFVSLETAFHQLRGPKSSCTFETFWYSNEAQFSPNGICSKIRIVGDRYYCQKCPCAFTTPMPGMPPNIDCTACDSSPEEICLCNGEDGGIYILKTIPIFGADWKQITEEQIPKLEGQVDRVSSIRNYASSLECLLGKAFVVPKPWNLKIRVKFK